MGKLIEIVATLGLMGLLFYGADLAAMVIRERVDRSVSWLGVFLRLLLSGGLLLFARWIYHQGHPFMPLPGVAFAASVVVTYSTIKSALRGNSPQPQI